jgi:hypothetical protein
MRLHAALIAATLLAPLSAYGLEPGQYPACKQAGIEFTDGATMCECPSLKAEAGFATGGPQGLVTSRRMQCTKGAWVATDATCVELKGRSEYLIEEHKKLYQLYCPRQSSAEETSAMIAKATPTQGVMLLTSICRRFSIPPAACSAVIEIVSASQK